MTRLTLTLRLPAEEDMARSCAGWATHLEMLIAALAVNSRSEFPVRGLQGYALKPIAPALQACCCRPDQVSRAGS